MMDNFPQYGWNGSRAAKLGLFLIVSAPEVHRTPRVFRPEYRDWLDLMLNRNSFSEIAHQIEVGKKTAADRTSTKKMPRWPLLESGLDHARSLRVNLAIHHAGAKSQHALIAGIANGEPDPLGDLYMAAIPFGEHGQYFTSWTVASSSLR